MKCALVEIMFFVLALFITPGDTQFGSANYFKHLETSASETFLLPHPFSRLTPYFPQLCASFISSVQPLSATGPFHCLTVKLLHGDRETECFISWPTQGKLVKENVQVYQVFHGNLLGCQSVPHLLSIHAQRGTDDTQRWQPRFMCYACMCIFVFLVIQILEFKQPTCSLGISDSYQQTFRLSIWLEQSPNMCWAATSEIRRSGEKRNGQDLREDAFLSFWLRLKNISWIGLLHTKLHPCSWKIAVDIIVALQGADLPLVMQPVNMFQLWKGFSCLSNTSKVRLVVPHSLKTGKPRWALAWESWTYLCMAPSFLHLRQLVLIRKMIWTPFVRGCADRIF